MSMLLKSSTLRFVVVGGQNHPYSFRLGSLIDFSLLVGFVKFINFKAFKHSSNEVRNALFSPLRTFSLLKRNRYFI